jgi:cysteine-rich repeat protein
MRYRQLRTLLAAIGACVFALSTCPSTSLASDDYFGTGDGHHGTKSVSGPEVVNAYSGLVVDVSVGDTSIEVADGAKFVPGDLVMLWQVNGYSTPPSGDQTEIDLSAQAVGRFELARVDFVLGNSLVLRDSMSSAFTAVNTQVVFVPEYTDVTVDAAGEVQAADWDPVAGEGGIVAFFATGTVTVDGRVTANGAGFLGGTDLGNSGTNGCTGLDEPSPTGAEKGESIAGLDFVSGDPPGGTGRGNRANGGGGGVCHNSGGGGGGHGGLGGLGGRTWRGDPDPIIANTGRDIGGLGGAPLNYSALNRLTMGGGGGAGQQNNDVGGAGSDGGGVVLVRASTVVGTGSFEANGDDGNDSTGGFNDAAGGGGAGGLVVVRTTGSLSCGSARAVGGDGGSAQFDDHGTGGGGAGGHTLLQGAVVACAADVSGGVPGVQTDLTDPPGVHYGALPGELGDEELVAGSLPVDTDGDGLWDVHEGAGDTDNDGSPEFRDVDDDGDGVPTATETSDANGDGDPSDANDQDADLTPDYLDLDSDDDGLTDTREAGGNDDDGDGSPDGCTDTAPVDGQCDGVSLSPPVNTDVTYVGGDALPDYLDTDADADGINDTDEAFDTDDDGVGDVVAVSNDHDGDGVDDAFDPDCVAVGNPVGCAVPGIPVTGATVQDDDGDGTPNWTQLCGDGYVTAVPAFEPCDDGDGDDANECNNACRFNVGFGTCSTVADCVSGVGVVCDGASALCQLANGNGPCTEGSEGSVCQSGVCDETSAICEACADDGDCAFSDRCDANACVPRTCGDGVLDPSESCDDGDVDDLDECTNSCLFNAGHGPCASADDCVGSALVCDDPAGLCRYPLGSGPCTEPDEASVCAGGICDPASSTCEACADAGDCAGGERCESNACVLATCGDGVLDSGEVCDDGFANGDAPQACGMDCRRNVGSACIGDDDCTADATCGEESTCTVPDPRTIDSDGDGIPDVVEEDGFILQGGRGVGCHVGVTRQGQPAGVLPLLLGLFLGIRRYRRT